MLVLVTIDDANVLPLEAAGIGVEVVECTDVEVLAIPQPIPAGQLLQHTATSSS